MSRPAIKIEGLSKEYILGNRQRGYQTFREVLTSAVAAPFRRLMRRQGDAPAPERFWALDDVSLEIVEGDVVGIIGRNGAGKSTLLKILSRITDPTKGEVQIRGRVASLLEVGTGFHPELTGRENIFLNGAILGMPRRQIQARFDEIVEFAEIARFIDTPVKRYSSGMYVRLAFSVAAHLETDILLVDEVLAVGDAAFQKKCLGAMQDLGRSGRTVLFVSHSMGSLEQLCRHGVVLLNGKVAHTGDIRDSVSHYLASSLDRAHGDALRERRDRRGSGRLRFVRVEALGNDGQRIDRIASGHSLTLRFHYEADHDDPAGRISLAFNLINERGTVISNLATHCVSAQPLPVYRRGYLECTWPRVSLRSGTYRSNLYCEVNGEVADWVQDAFQLEVLDGNFYGTGRLPPAGQGDVLMEHAWTGGRLED
jgi:lipopolysaccharide transport system ATP-binding protein